MITFGLGTLMLITMGLGTALRPSISRYAGEPRAPEEVSFTEVPRDITFIDKEAENE